MIKCHVYIQWNVLYICMMWHATDVGSCSGVPFIPSLPVSVVLCFHPCLVSVHFTGSSLHPMNFWTKSFFPSYKIRFTVILRVHVDGSQNIDNYFDTYLGSKLRNIHGLLLGATEKFHILYSFLKPWLRLATTPICWLHIQRNMSSLVLKFSILSCEATALHSISMYYVANLMQLLASHGIIAVNLQKILSSKAAACRCSVQSWITALH